MKILSLLTEELHLLPQRQALGGGSPLYLPNNLNIPKMWLGKIHYLKVVSGTKRGRWSLSNLLTLYFGSVQGKTFHSIHIASLGQTFVLAWLTSAPFSYTANAICKVYSVKFGFHYVAPVSGVYVRKTRLRRSLRHSEVFHNMHTEKMREPSPSVTSCHPNKMVTWNF